VTKSLPVFYVLYGMAGVGAAIVYGGSVGSALKWFKENRGLAAGIMSAGFGGGAALFNPFILQIIKNYGYESAFLWTGMFQGLMIVAAAQFVRHPPAAPAAAAVRSASQPAPQVGKRDFTTGEMLRSPTFYFMYLMFVLMATGGLVLTGQAGLVARSWGISLGALGVVATGGPIMNTLSRTGFGWLSDRIGRELAMGIGFTLNAGCLLLTLLFGHLSDTWFVVTMLLVFVTWGEMYSLFPSLTADYFGTRFASGNYGLLYTGKGVASIIGGGIAAMLFERFGSWSAPFAGSAVMALIAGLGMFGLRSMRAAQAAKLVGTMSPATAK
jgi:OFA family oxalate/formate antiporter-like MFS transporter